MWKNIDDNSPVLGLTLFKSHVRGAVKGNRKALHKGKVFVFFHFDGRWTTQATRFATPERLIKITSRDSPNPVQRKLVAAWFGRRMTLGEVITEGPRPLGELGARRQLPSKPSLIQIYANVVDYEKTAREKWGYSKEEIAEFASEIAKCVASDNSKDASLTVPVGEDNSSLEDDSDQSESKDDLIRKINILCSENELILEENNTKLKLRRMTTSQLQEALAKYAELAEFKRRVKVKRAQLAEGGERFSVLESDESESDESSVGRGSKGRHLTHAKPEDALEADNITTESEKTLWQKRLAEFSRRCKEDAVKSKRE